MKLIVTIGPASEKEETISKLLKIADGVRLNLKHGDFDEHERRIKIIRKFEKGHNKYVPIIGDIPGVEIRTGDMEDLEVKENQEVLINFSEEYEKGLIWIPFPKVSRYLREGDRILIDDGQIELKVIEKIDNHVFKAKVIRGGIIKARKSVSFPDTEIELSVFENKKNEELLKFVIENDLDYVAISFVQSVYQVLEVKEFLKKYSSDQWVMSKIEHRVALKNLKEIIKASDSIMVARGDLAVEVGIENLPLIQKRIVDECQRLLKPVYVATQFLASMIYNPIPTRAEVSDIANAILDGADGIILTNETAVGKYPVEAAMVAKKVIQNTVEFANIKPNIEVENLNTIVAKHAVEMNREIKNSIIIAETETGFTAINVTRFKPKEIIVITNNKRVARNVSILWGVKKVIIAPEIINKIVDEEILRKITNLKDVVAIYVGSPILKRKTTLIHVLQL